MRKVNKALRAVKIKDDQHLLVYRSVVCAIERLLRHTISRKLRSPFEAAISVKPV